MNKTCRLLATISLSALAIACDDGSAAASDPNLDAETGQIDGGVDRADGGPDVGEIDAGGPDARSDLDAAPADGAAPDASVTGGLALNELVARQPVTGGGGDWIELVATGAEPVRLAAYTLRDENHDPAPLPEIVLAPGDFVVLEAVGASGEPGPMTVPFRLGGNDELILEREGAIVDQIGWTAEQVVAGSGWGRLPDATGVWAPTQPTPGAPNVALEAPPPETPFEPTRVVTLRFTVAPADWEALLASPEQETYYPADMDFGGLEVPQVALRTKGFSSLRAIARDEQSIRYSFKVDINRNVPGQRLLGSKKFVLNNGFADPSFLNEYLAYGVMREAGLPAPRVGFADVWINDLHMGLYSIVQVIDGDFLRDHFDDAGGDLYKPERPAGDLRDMGDGLDAYRGRELKRNEQSSDEAAWMALIEALNRGAPLEAALDVDRALRYLAANVALVNLDSYIGMSHNYYLYADMGRMVVLPWDLNMAFGKFTCGCDVEGLVGFLLDEPTCGEPAQRPLVARLLESRERRAAYHDQVAALLDGPMDPARLAPLIRAAADLIRPYVEADDMKLFPTRAFEQAVADEPGASPRRNILAMVRARVAHLRGQLAGELPSTNGGRGNCEMGGPGMHPCGDGRCVRIERENPTLCPRDCEDRPPGFDWCGDGICDALERDRNLCDADCRRGHPCGDGRCGPAEQDDPTLCPRDCEDRPPGFDWCGDGICDGLERETGECPEDCGG